MYEKYRIPGALYRSALSFLALFGALSIALADAETVRVAHVLDGDSLRLSDRREVRLIGINAPEIGRDGFPGQPLAVAARDRINKLVRGHSVQLGYDIERTDHYGRTLAYVYLPDGRDLQEILLRDGLAWFIGIAPNVAHRDRYRSAEAQARAAHRGIWSLPEYEPIPAERLTLSDTGFLRVVGTVKRIEHHRDWNVLRLTPTVELTLPRGITGLTVSSLAGRRVVARGWLTAYKNGLRMRISDSTMLETPP